MRNWLMLLGAVVAVCLVALPALSGPGKGPAEKATGGITVQEGGNTASVEFNAHEAKGDRPAKGKFTWTLGDNQRTIVIDVQAVKVDGDTAWFAGVCTEDSGETLEGRYFFVKVVDGGEPPEEGVDQVSWEWLPASATAADAAAKVTDEDDPANNKQIVKGNIQVHSS